MSVALPAGALYSILGAAAAVTTLVGSGSAARIFPMVRPGAGVGDGLSDLPAITFQIIDTDGVDANDGHSGLSFARVQVDCWATSYGGAASLGEKVRLALENYSGTAGGVAVSRITHIDTRDDYSPPIDGSDVGTYRQSVDVRVGYASAKPA